MKKPLIQIASNVIAANHILDREDSKERDDFYMLIDWIKITAQQILDTK